jgi:hypothetical protein
VRLWSLHPSTLDRIALVACWREGLLAQKVLAGETRGYTRHPQLERFRACDDPLAAIGHYLEQLRLEAAARGYRFDGSRVRRADAAAPGIPVHDGQLAYELAHLRAKVAIREPAWRGRLAGEPVAAPSFVVVPGGIEAWERPPRV